MLNKNETCKICGGNGYLEDEMLNIEAECPECNGNGEIEKEIGENEIVYCNIYAITREYGGDEEGGWWYNYYRTLEVYPVRNKNSDLIQEEMEKEWSGIKEGNIYSVLGGTELLVLIEEKAKESETRERPHYE